MLRNKVGTSTSRLTQSESKRTLNSSLRHGSFAAFWLQITREDLLVAATLLAQNLFTLVTLWGNYEGISQCIASNSHIYYADNNLV